MMLQRTRGVSLIELLIATFVVSMGVLGTVSALWYGIRSERYSDRRAQAVYQAREMINLIRTRNLPFADATAMTVGSELNDGDYDNDADDDTVWKDFDAAPFADDFTDEFNFQRHVEMKVLSTDSNSHLSDLAAIKVIIKWVDGSTEKEVKLWAYHRRP